MEVAAAAPQTRFDTWGLVWTLIRTDFKVRYHGTAMGFFWALLKPLSVLLVLMGVFSLIFSFDPHYKLHLVVGLFLWDFFAEATKVGLTSLQAKSYLVGKTRFPRWILVVTSSSNELLTLLVVSTAVLGFLLVRGPVPSVVGIFLYVVYLGCFVLIVTGMSLATSVLFLRYRDLNQVWEVVIHAGFFVAPIVYPIALLPERLHWLLYLWPPTPVIMFARSVLVDGHLPTLRAHLYLFAATAIVLGAGVLLFRRYSPTAAERL